MVTGLAMLTVQWVVKGDRVVDAISLDFHGIEGGNMVDVKVRKLIEPPDAGTGGRVLLVRVVLVIGTIMGGREVDDNPSPWLSSRDEKLPGLAFDDQGLPSTVDSVLQKKETKIFVKKKRLTLN